MQNKYYKQIINKLNASYFDDNLIHQIARCARYYILRKKTASILVNCTQRNFIFNMISSIARLSPSVNSFEETAPFSIVDYCWLTAFLKEEFPDDELTNSFASVTSRLLNSKVIGDFESIDQDFWEMNIAANTFTHTLVPIEEIFKAIRKRTELLTRHLFVLDKINLNELKDYCSYDYHIENRTEILRIILGFAVNSKDAQMFLETSLNFSKRPVFLDYKQLFFDRKDVSISNLMAFNLVNGF